MPSIVDYCTGTDLRFEKTKPTSYMYSVEVPAFIVNVICLAICSEVGSGQGDIFFSSGLEHPAFHDRNKISALGGVGDIGQTVFNGAPHTWTENIYYYFGHKKPHGTVTRL